ncbi:MAG: DUF2283 domain-containing protein [Nanoarchaeota archaeon]
MATNHLDARGKGVYTYDYDNDILLFCVKDREYARSLDFEGIVVDVDTEGLVKGIQVFDAAKTFRIPKLHLKNISGFEFYASVDHNIVQVQLRFMYVSRNKQKVVQGQDFVREAVNARLKNGEVRCSVA